MDAYRAVTRNRAVAARRRRSSNGMTLVEMLVALAVAGVILSAGAIGLVGAIGGLDYARENREATDLLTEVMEGARAADHAGVAVRSDAAGEAELAADPNLTVAGGARWLDPDGSGPLGAEEVLTSPTGAIPLRRHLVRDGTPYTVRTYVTEPAGAVGTQRRVLAIVSWQRAQAVHERRAATVVAATRRGLPLPRFTVAGDSTVTVNLGAVLAVPLMIANRGYRDRWTLDAAAPGRAWDLGWYLDDDGNGLHDAGETTAMTDTNSDGAVDSGLLETDEVIKLVAVATVDPYDVPGESALTITATPVSQPESGSKSVVHAVTVVSQACAGCTYEPVFLANDEGVPADAPIAPRMELLDGAGPALDLPNYDTDRDLDPGRTLAAGGSPTGSDPVTVAVWQRQVADATTVEGTALVRLYVAAQGLDPNATAQLRVDLGHVRQNGTSWTVLGTATTVALGFGAGFAVVDLAVPVAEATIPRNRWLQLRLTAPTATAPVWLGYGTAGSPALLQLPVVT